MIKVTDWIYNPTTEMIHLLVFVPEQGIIVQCEVNRRLDIVKLLPKIKDDILAGKYLFT